MSGGSRLRMVQIPLMFWVDYKSPLMLAMLTWHHTGNSMLNGGLEESV